MRILVCSQTPLIRFIRPIEVAAEPVDVSKLVRDVDFIFSPGGVTRMVYPLLQHMLSRGVADDAHWVSLNPVGPSEAVFNRLKLHFVRLGGEALKRYGTTKEWMWRLLHGVQEEPPLSLIELAWSDDYAYYNQYSRVCSEKIMMLDRELDVDIFYIHDFQQLPTGVMIETMKPKLFRWHIPFDERVIPPEWSEFLGRYLNAYDAVVVSCRSYP
ncbi:MAG: hypothetical protein QXX57_05770, partial [Nitrososphaerota archaeon]